MIIDDTHKIVFIHIPKCGGTSVRSLIQKYDSTDGKFTARVEDHPMLGKLDYVHIPLFVIKEHFPREFSAISRYESYAIVRNPMSRFASSVSQRLLMYGKKPIYFCSTKEIKREVLKTIEFLSSRRAENTLLPADYIHFQRQIDYIYINGEQLVQNVFPIENINDLIKTLLKKIGKSCHDTKYEVAPKENESFSFKSDTVRYFLYMIRPCYRPLFRRIPRGLKLILKEKVTAPRDNRFAEIFDALEVREFILNYYKDDIALHKKSVTSSPKNQCHINDF